MSRIKAVIALGYFDGVHLGHKKVLCAAKTLAKELGCISVAFTFDGNLKGKLLGEKCIMTREENYALLKKQVDEIFCAPLTEDFLSLTPDDFLRYLDGVYDVKGYCVGKDYRFGKGGLGDVDLLKKFAFYNSKNINVVDEFTVDGEKVSSTRIKRLLSEGNISGANNLLGYDYFVSGEVFADRKVGGKMGFPTANIKVVPDKCELKNGVYAGYSIVGGVRYKAIINYGDRPTFGLDEKLIETHLIGFSGNLYGSKIVVNFTQFIRDIKKFGGEEELKARLTMDKIFAEENVK